MVICLARPPLMAFIFVLLVAFSVTAKPPPPPPHLSPPSSSRRPPSSPRTPSPRTPPPPRPPPPPPPRSPRFAPQPIQPHPSPTPRNNLGPPPPPPPPREQKKRPPRLPNTSNRPKAKQRRAMNLGKRVGLSFAGIAVIMQFLAFGFLIYKRMQLYKLRD